MFAIRKNISNFSKDYNNVFYLVFKILQNPLSWIIGSDVVVVDPPRRGLDASLRQMLESVPSIEKRMRSSSQRLINFFTISFGFQYNQRYPIIKTQKPVLYGYVTFLFFQFKLERKRGEEAVDFKSKGTFNSSWQQADL